MDTRPWILAACLVASLGTLLLGTAFPLPHEESAVVQSRSSKTDEQTAIDARQSETDPYPYHHFVTLTAIRTYQLLISPSKGSICPMHPHCSLYGYQAFHRHHPLKAFLKTADRLHRCGHDLDNYPPVEVKGAVRFYDPVDLSSVYEGSYYADMRDPSRLMGETSAGLQMLASGLDPDTNHQESEEAIAEDARLFHFAQMLQAEGDYGRAITEYRRLVAYFPDSRYYGPASRAVFDSYYKAGQYLDAIHWGQDLLGSTPDLEDADELRFWIGAGYFKLRNYRLAGTCLREMDNHSNPMRDKSLMLQGLAYARDGLWRDAERSFAAVPHDSEFSGKARECERLSQRGAQLRPKSPALAGFLSLIPGLGYLYNGYGQTALAAFIVNSLFIGATVEAFDRDNDGLGSILGVLSFGWYVGNIYGSVLSTHRRNLKTKEDLLSQFDVGFQF